MRCFRIQSGFSLVELVIVIVIVGILATGIATFITLPVQGFIDLSRRATLVYSAESALRRMQRDIRRALPNSIRVRVVAGVSAIEMINTIEGARYRSAPPPGGPDRRLQITSADTDFDILGNFTLATLNNPNINFVAIYNIGSVDGAGVPLAGSNAYAGGNPNVITPSVGYTITLTDDPVTANEDHINIDDGGSGGWQFTYHSPNNRVYLVDTAISYVCDGGQLRRYTNYNFTNDAQPVPPPVGFAVMADNIANCDFTYDPGTPSRAGLMTLDLTVTDAMTSESVRLLHQVHVDNAP